MTGRTLPEHFLQSMERLLGEDYPAFLASYEQQRQYGLRVNTLKISAEAFRELADWPLTPVPWSPVGYYLPETARPGKHPYYHAGLYYIQEPSAMAPVELLQPEPGDRVLDLCAAPGGKTTQIAAKLQGRGLVAANDIHSDRVKALVKNLELGGVRNAVVLNEDPAKLVQAFDSYFDKILVDAPCSGEGMFRKEEDMAKAWEPSWTAKYAAMQHTLLAQAARMLRPGGRLVYSTCTFSPEENEAIIAAFLAQHGDFEVEPVPLVGGRGGWAPGRPDWLGPAAPSRADEVAGTARLWPHRLCGEGHYAAALRRRGESAQPQLPAAPEPAPRAGRAPRRAGTGAPPGGMARGGVARGGAPDGAREALARFAAEQLTAPPWDGAELVWRSEHAYAAPPGLPPLEGIRVIRPGWYLGGAAKQRFAPSQALALALRPQDAQRSVSFRADDPRAVRYLKGETVELPLSELVSADAAVTPKGYCLIAVDGYTVGWAKWQDGMLKNEYPAGWRWT
ncbi:NOL1/NOP2/sun family putative RNA methylase [Paenibacillus sp. UNCCL117]|uniref:RsmB/NOP family class I SAM-dependent RNA methyltransferase n=1 Tax=unclassified Paenibacillus TaxID=185978 RepID=UPI000883F6A8|nr:MULTISPECIES: RsmB/NOP family class I SAM-dependent RNA methyltransferase [unclassified Paenibacillus]SDC23543.1 NOL1/NOP2/sun family putative RNA methylase [Paenibacillus sp. cl123]SFW19321.1 NOL1/NOP2/sun family putative RNA methylase [Paenibacillus sp. UNCCL117]